MEKYIKGKVSAVIPVFNGELYLSPMLDSVLGQTYPFIEAILIDDGSEDKTLRVAESYREKFTSKGYGYQIVRSEHRNASAALNQGFSYVTGEYLIWPDSDDRLEKESVEKRVRFLQENPEYHCVRSLSYYFQQETGRLLPADEKTGDISRENLFWDILEGRTYVCCGCYMLRTESFFEIYPGKRIPEYDVGQNFQMLLPFMFHHPCPTIPEELYGVCVRQGSHSRRVLTKEEEEKKYRDYESLIDEIASICRIEDKASKDRIEYWKTGRRYRLAVKYKDRKKAIRNLWRMSRYGKAGFYRDAKGFFRRRIFYAARKWRIIN